MTQAPRHLKKLMAAGLASGSVLLSACGPLISFGDDGPADRVYTLRYQGGYPAASTSGPVVYVEEPHFADDLDGRGISVLLDGGRRSTIAGVRWSSPLSELVRNYMTRALADDQGAQIVSEGAIDINAACRIGSKVWALELVPSASGTDDQVTIAIEAMLVRLKDSRLISHKTIERSVSLGGSGDAAVMAAFNAAMAGVADDMQAWFGAAQDGCVVEATQS